MDDETRALLHDVCQYLSLHSSAIQELRMAILALRNTIRDLGPEAEALYSKHYLAAIQGPLKTVRDAQTEALSQIIERLKS